MSHLAAWSHRRNLPRTWRWAPLSMHGPLVVRALLIVGLIVTAQAFAPEVVWDLTREDGVVETATVLVWLIAAATFIDVSLRGRGRGGWILAAQFLMFAAVLVYPRRSDVG